MEQLTDEDLARLWQEGDVSAFDALFDRHHADVYQLARWILGRFDGAEDVLQETFLAVVQHIGQYAAAGPFRSWLLQSARNRALNRLAAERLRHPATQGGPAILPQRSNADPMHAASDNEEARLVRQAVDELPDRQREMMALFALQEMGYRQIAEITHTPLNTVKTLIRRARLNLADRFQRPVARG